jgi:hypothetical protein
MNKLPEKNGTKTTRYLQCEFYPLWTALMFD